MTLEALIAVGVTALAAVAGSSLYVRAASEREREIHLREDAAHRAARRRRLLPTRSLAPEAGPLLPAESVSPPMARSPRRGGVRLRLRYAALILLVWAIPGSPGSDSTGESPVPRSPSLKRNNVERARENSPRPAREPECGVITLTGGSPAPDSSRDAVHPFA